MLNRHCFIVILRDVLRPASLVYFRIRVVKASSISIKEYWPSSFAPSTYAMIVHTFGNSWIPSAEDAPGKTHDEEVQLPRVRLVKGLSVRVVQLARKLAQSLLQRSSPRLLQKVDDRTKAAKKALSFAHDSFSCISLCHLHQDLVCLQS